MNRLKFLRLEKNENMETIAKYLNVTIQTISNYENEKRDMSPETIVKLSEYFNVTTDYLLGKSDIRNSKPTDELLELSKIGFSKNNYNPPTEIQKEQIKGLLEVILKDNKKKTEDK